VEEGASSDFYSGSSSEEEEEERGSEQQQAASDADANADRERARPLRAALGAHVGRARRRGQRVHALGPEGFAQLVARLDAAHARLVSAAHPPVEAREGWAAASCRQDEEETEEDEEPITTSLRARAREWDPMMPVDGRHARQHAAIAAVLQRRGLLPSSSLPSSSSSPPATPPPPPRTLVELGAGKGYLSAWLVLESAPAPAASSFGALLLIDAAGHLGKKADRRLRVAAVRRVTADLRDVQLSRLLAEEEGSGGGFLAVGKHLCGVATDYALRMFARGVAEAAEAAARDRREEKAGPRSLSAVAVATCCHHRGTWRDFCGRQAWRTVAGLSRADFEAALWLCGWSNCGPVAKAAAKAPAPRNNADGADDNQNDTPRDWHHRMVLASSTSQHQMDPDVAAAGLGRRCRELLDSARCAWLEARLSSSAAGAAAASSAAAAPSSVVEHVAFVAPSVTPENRMIVGRLLSR
jgi:hypothetical protein